MAQSQRVQILADKSGELSLLAEYLSNPKLIKELADEIKQLNTLTTDEEAKVAEARELLVKRENILKEIQAQKDALVISTADYNSKVENLNVKLKDLAAAQTALQKQQTALGETEAYLANAKKQLEVDRKAMQDGFENDRKNYEAALDKVTARELANKVEADRLRVMDQDLKTKVAKANQLFGG